MSFDHHLSVGVLRVNGGLDISEMSVARQRIMETTRQCSDTSEVSHTTDDEQGQIGVGVNKYQEGGKIKTIKANDFK